MERRKLIMTNAEVLKYVDQMDCSVQCPEKEIRDGKEKINYDER